MCFRVLYPMSLAIVIPSCHSGRVVSSLYGPSHRRPPPMIRRASSVSTRWCSCWFSCCRRSISCCCIATIRAKRFPVCRALAAGRWPGLCGPVRLAAGRRLERVAAGRLGRRRWRLGRRLGQRRLLLAGGDRGGGAADRGSGWAKSRSVNQSAVCESTGGWGRAVGQ